MTLAFFLEELNKFNFQFKLNKSKQLRDSHLINLTIFLFFQSWIWFLKFLSCFTFIFKIKNELYHSKLKKNPKLFNFCLLKFSLNFEIRCFISVWACGAKDKFKFNFFREKKELILLKRAPRDIQLCLHKYTYLNALIHHFLISFSLFN